MLHKVIYSFSVIPMAFFDRNRKKNLKIFKLIFKLQYKDTAIVIKAVWWW